MPTKKRPENLLNDRSTDRDSGMCPSPTDRPMATRERVPLGAIDRWRLGDASLSILAVCANSRARRAVDAIRRDFRRFDRRRRGAARDDDDDDDDGIHTRGAGRVPRRARRVSPVRGRRGDDGFGFGFGGDGDGDGDVSTRARGVRAGVSEVVGDALRERARGGGETARGAG